MEDFHLPKESPRRLGHQGENLLWPLGVSH